MIRILLLLCALALPSFAQDFKFTAIPDQDTVRLEKRFSKVATYLSKELGINVTYVPVKSYAASVTAFRNNQVQLAWFGGLSGVKARRSVPGSQAIAQGEEDQYFVTYFIANAKSGLESSPSFPNAIKGKTFTFGSKGSTSGRLMPEFYIRKYFANESPDKIFKRVGYSGDHSKTIALVQSGAYEVGAVNFKVWETELANGKIDPKKVQVIWKTPVYPDYNWTLRAGLDKAYGDGFSEKVQKALLNMKDKNLLDAFPRSRFVDSNNENYKPILDTAIEIGIIEN